MHTRIHKAAKNQLLGFIQVLAQPSQTGYPGTKVWRAAGLHASGGTGPLAAWLSHPRGACLESSRNPDMLMCVVPAQAGRGRLAKAGRRQCRSALIFA